MRRLCLAATVVAVTAAGCGSAPRPASFVWLKPSPPPVGWRALHTAIATLAYPPRWHRAHADPGAVTATLQTGHSYHGYLNATPQQADERLAGWAEQRTARNTDDGDKRVTAVASAEHLRFMGGTGSCVIDDYVAKVGTVRYREIACFVVGRHGGTVLIAASPVAELGTRLATLEQAVSHFSVH